MSRGKRGSRSALDWDRTRSSQKTMGSLALRIDENRRAATMAQLSRLARELDNNTTAREVLETYLTRHYPKEGMQSIGFYSARSLLTWLIDRHGDADSFPLLPPGD